MELLKIFYHLKNKNLFIIFFTFLTSCALTKGNIDDTLLDLDEQVSIRQINEILNLKCHYIKTEPLIDRIKQGFFYGQEMMLKKFVFDENYHKSDTIIIIQKMDLSQGLNSSGVVFKSNSKSTIFNMEYSDSSKKPTLKEIEEWVISNQDLNFLFDSKFLKRLPKICPLSLEFSQYKILFMITYIIKEKSNYKFIIGFVGSNDIEREIKGNTFK